MPNIPSPVTGTPRLAYLDGLRGWMALVVLFSHLFAAWLLRPLQLEQHGAGWLVDGLRYTPLGVATDGLQAIYVFFAISGVALTYPVLRSSLPGRTLGVMALYRYPRLTVPIFMSCLAAWVLLAGGALMNAPAAARHADAQWWAQLYSFPPDFLAMARFALWDTYRPNLPGALSWNLVLWTMPVELGGSFLVFALLAFVRARWLRLALAAGLAASCVALDFYGYYFGFCVGYLLAELLVAGERSAALGGRLAAATPVGWVYLAAALACSLSLQAASFGASRAGYMLAMNLIATLAVAGVVLTAPVRAALSNRMSRFLGRISFGLYLTHLPVICSFSSALYLAAIDVLPYGLVVVLVGGLTLVVAIATAYLFTLLVEERLLVWVKRPIAGFYNNARSSVLRILP